MCDTNVLVSAALYPNSTVSHALFKAMQEHTLIICTYVLEELQAVFARKFPDKEIHLDTYLSKLAYELCYTPKVYSDTPNMRDANDRPILQAAIDADVDVIITGDNDFHALDLKKPVITSPAEFMNSSLFTPDYT